MKHRFRHLSDLDLPAPQLTIAALGVIALLLSVPVWLILTLLF